MLPPKCCAQLSARSGCTKNGMSHHTRPAGEFQIARRWWAQCRSKPDWPRRSIDCSAALPEPACSPCNGRRSTDSCCSRRRRREVAQNRLPSRTIATVVAHQEIRPLLRVRALIDLAGPIHPRNAADCFRIAHGQQLVFNFFEQRIRCRAGLNNSFAFAALADSGRDHSIPGHRRECGSSPRWRRPGSDLDSVRSSA